ncbi:hypothetical protein PR048_031901 [Dryococelus australis]|uniref:DDE-1 domain-containing protein n=1 Tax=Dryococelus australis TaxID=614101 RepID=A0ABQ9G9E0_9NEOP|nr:hypothetical protein PR048_031901 [Dryococelus australis]
MAGSDWIQGFKERNPEIQKQHLQHGRWLSTNSKSVNFSKHLKKLNITVSRIHKVDESSLSTVQKTQKVFAATGKKQGRVICCISPVGFVPPALIFPHNAPHETLGIAHESGWMTGENFLTWLKHLSSFVKPTQENKIFLAVDGHLSHKRVDVLTYAKENGMVI